MFASTKEKVAVGVLLLTLLLLPAPLLPPHRLAEAVQSVFGVSWKMACFAAAIGLHAVLYGSLGMIAAFSVRQART
jgi:hypothetical protein